MNGLEILIAHPGGPFWARRHAGAWSIIKGEVGRDEDGLEAARREFAEETGWVAPSHGFVPLGEVIQKAGKRIVAWAFAADFDPATLVSNNATATIRGRSISFAEIDEVRWCSESEARDLLNPAQAVYYERLNNALGDVR